MPRRLDGVAHLVTVASGKGGVGKTTVTVNLALALAAGGARVGVFDADVQGPNVPLMLGIPAPEARPGGFTMALGRAQRAPYIPPVEFRSLRLMSLGLLLGDADTVRAGSESAGLLVAQTLADVRWGELDYLLVDLPPGTGEPQRTLLATYEVDGVVLVTTPQDMALMDTGRSLGQYRDAGAPVLGYVENMAYLDCPHCGEPVEVFHRGERAWRVREELTPLGRIPLHPDVGRGIEAGAAATAGDASGGAAAAFREVARRVTDALGTGTG